MNIIQQVIQWSERRIPRYVCAKSLRLRCRLTKEESDETVEAIEELLRFRFTTTIEAWDEQTIKLKAHIAKECFDQVFVAIGTLWLLDFDADDIEYAFEQGCISNNSKPVYQLKSGEKGGKGDAFIPAEPKIVEYLKFKNANSGDLL